MLKENKKNLIKLIELLKQLLNNKKYEAEYKNINDTLLFLTEMDLENIDINQIEKYNDIIYELERKYDDVFDLSYYFDPIYIKIKKNIHKKEVNKIREDNRKKRGTKNEF